MSGGLTSEEVLGRRQWVQIPASTKAERLPQTRRVAALMAGLFPGWTLDQGLHVWHSFGIRPRSVGS